MPSKALEAERTRLQAAVKEHNAPGDHHELSLVDARENHLVVHVNTPQRGTPFRLQQIGKEGAKTIREPINMGYVVASKLIIPAHDGLMEVLPRHAAMVGLLGSGELVVTTARASIPHAKMPGRTVEVPDATTFRMFVSGGAFSVRDNKVLVLPERGFPADLLTVDDIDDAERRRAIQTKMIEGLEGDALVQAIREVKLQEVTELRTQTEAEKPSAEKQAAIERLRAMQKVLQRS